MATTDVDLEFLSQIITAADHMTKDFSPEVLENLEASPSWFDSDAARDGNFPAEGAVQDPEAFALALLQRLEFEIVNNLTDSVYDVTQNPLGPLRPDVRPEINRNLRGSSNLTTRAYTFAWVKFWLSEQMKFLLNTLLDLPPQARFERIKGSIREYELAHQLFLEVRMILGVGSGDSIGRSAQELVLGQFIAHRYIWQFFLLIQLIGEHMGFALKNVTRFLYCTHHQQGAEASIQRFTNRLSLDWGTNVELSRLFCGNLHQCPTEEAFVTSLSECKMSILHWHSLNLLRQNRDPPARDVDHSNCEGLTCSCPPSNPFDGIPKHCNQDCQCAPVGIPIDGKEGVCEAIKDELLPLVKIHLRTSSSPSVEVAMMTHDLRQRKEVKYVAISHVWSDGRGNKNGNTLPSCQLSFIRKTCCSDRDIPIWMDTLCIPRGEDVKHKKARRQAISSMNDIYLNAAEVVVLSNDLLSIEYNPDGIDLMELWLRVRGSAWMRRFWTLQEGAFGVGRLFICFKNRLVNYAEASAQFQRAYQWSPIQFGSDMQIVFAEIRDASSKRETVGGLIVEILDHFKSRSTTWEIDQPVIMAGLLGINPTAISNVGWRIMDAPERRLELMYERLSSFPTAVLYSSAPKMTAPGLRWAPRSVKVPDLIDDHSLPRSVLGESIGRLSPKGLEFGANVILFSLNPDAKSIPRFFQILLDGTSCLCPYHSPITLRVEMVDVKEYKRIKPPQPSEIDKLASSEPFRTAFRANKDRSGYSAQGNDYALILHTFNREVAETKGFKTRAAIMRITNEGKDFFIERCTSNDGKRRPLTKKLKTFWQGVNYDKYMYLGGPYVAPANVESLGPHDSHVDSDWGTLLSALRKRYPSLNISPHTPRDVRDLPLTEDGDEMAIYSETPTLSSRAKGKQPDRSDEVHHHSSSNHMAYTAFQTAVDSSLLSSNHISSNHITPGASTSAITATIKSTLTFQGYYPDHMWDIEIS